VIQEKLVVIGDIMFGMDVVVQIAGVFGDLVVAVIVQLDKDIQQNLG
jgi:hypothetical protein